MSYTIKLHDSIPTAILNLHRSTPPVTTGRSKFTHVQELLCVSKPVVLDQQEKLFLYTNPLTNDKVVEHKTFDTARNKRLTLTKRASNKSLLSSNK
jgi:hypothetical protein